MDAVDETDAIETFITRWSQSEVNERANFQSFANELSHLLQVTTPDPAVTNINLNNYTFEGSVEFNGRARCGSISLESPHPKPFWPKHIQSFLRNSGC